MQLGISSANEMVEFDSRKVFRKITSTTSVASDENRSIFFHLFSFDRLEYKFIMIAPTNVNSKIQLCSVEKSLTFVAMGNTPINIQQEADIISKTNDEDGYAYVVRHLLNI